MKRALYALPFLAFLALAIVFYRSLNGPPPDEIPSAMIDKPAPRLDVLPLDSDAKGFASRDLSAGHVTVVNFFASWCIPCREEAPLLEQLSHRKDFALYGIVWKDKPQTAREFLNEFGNPFAQLGADPDNRIGIEWGVYGAPETYIVDGHGIIRARIVGALTPETVTSTLNPAVERAK